MTKSKKILIIFLFFLLILALRIYYNSIYKKSVSVNDLLSICIIASEAGGYFVKSVKLEKNLNQKSKGKTKEGANDPVTNGDLYSHNAIMQTLLKKLPLIKIVSEEKQTKFIKYNPLYDVRTLINNNQNFLIEDLLIWVDPLDATQEYTEDLLNYVTTMACVVYQNKPIIGVIHQPFLNETYWAAYNETSDNLIKLKNQPHALNSMQIIVSRSHSGNIKYLMDDIIQSNYNITPAGGAGFKVLELVKGNADVYLHETFIKKWDICAGNAILNAVGGSMTDLSGSHISYDKPQDPVLKNGLIAVADQSILENIKFKDST